MLIIFVNENIFSPKPSFPFIQSYKLKSALNWLVISKAISTEIIKQYP